MQAFVPKSRRPRFELILKIIDLNNIPLSSGTGYVKWSLPSSSASEHHGQTSKACLQEHRACWNYERLLPIRLTIDRNQVLQDCEIQFEVFQDFDSGIKGDKCLLGRIRLNLAEYVDSSDDNESITRRYLMQDSKINSTLKVGITIRHVEGERNFTTPALKPAMVFGGIAGVVAEQTESDDLGRQPSLPSINIKSREVADMQDMYRRTLAASWNAPVHELSADRLIEKLFAGEDIFMKRVPESRHGALGENDDNDSLSGIDTNGKRGLSPGFGKRLKSPTSSHVRGGSKGSDSPPSGHADKNASLERRLFDSAQGKASKSRQANWELTEFDVREDLKSWVISTIN